MQTEILGHYVGQGLLTSDGAFWLRQRRMIQPAFHRSKLDTLVRIVQDEIEVYFGEEWGGGGARQLYPDMHRLAFRIVARALFSTALKEDQISKLSNEISAIQTFVVDRIRQPWMHWWFVISGAMKKHDKISDTVRETIMGVIRERMKNPIDANDLLDLLLSTRYEDTGEPMSEGQILDESLILFAAGHETSAVALTWTLYLLSKHPEHWEAIRAEAKACTFDSMQSVMQMQYTRQVIEESMRIYSPAWMIDRLSNDEDEILGYRYPKDTFILLWLYGLHHDEDIWSDHKTFDPSRFDPEKKKAMPPYSYVPFGGGPRLCIGYQFAMLEMLQVLGHIALNYNVTVTEMQVDLRPLVTLHPKQDVAARVTRRMQ